MISQMQTAMLILPYVMPIVIALAFIAACSLFHEPNRRSFSALMIAGAGAAYLGGGLGGWEIVFCVLLTFMAYRGLSDYRYIGTAWVLHTCWDVLHDLYANPIIPFVQTSSTGCAICDLVLAAWYFLGAPSIYRLAPARAKAPQR
jgi:hypothetical protein